jgi:hypothetical protein
MQDDMQEHEISVDNRNFCKSIGKLLPILMWKMDNYEGEHSYVFSFLSLLTSRRVFEIFEV